MQRQLSLYSIELCKLKLPVKTGAAEGIFTLLWLCKSLKHKQHQRVVSNVSVISHTVYRVYMWRESRQSARHFHLLFMWVKINHVDEAFVSTGDGYSLREEVHTHTQPTHLCPAHFAVPCRIPLSLHPLWWSKSKDRPNIFLLFLLLLSFPLPILQFLQKVLSVSLTQRQPRTLESTCRDSTQRGCKQL